MKFLDTTGLTKLWGIIKATFVAKESGKVLSSNDYTTAEKTKLSGIATGATAYTHPTASGNKHIPTGGATGNVLTWASDGTAAWGAGVSAAEATATTAGLMSAADKAKLTAVEASAQKNSSITKAEIEAKLTGAITTHSHAATDPEALTETEITSICV